jgi:hypothetical protein
MHPLTEPEVYFARADGMNEAIGWFAADGEALAALEILVHLSSVEQFPEYICVKASIP